MESDMIRLTALNFLSYQEMEELKTEGSPYKEIIIETLKSNLLKNLAEQTPNDVDLDLAFRIQIQLQDDMNLVGKIEQIPIHHAIFNGISICKTPDHLPVADYGRDKLKMRDRIKVLFKGRI